MSDASSRIVVIRNGAGGIAAQASDGVVFDMFMVAPETEVGKLPIFRTQVPLDLPSSQKKVMKQVEMVQQPKHTLVVKVDRSCLFAADQWKTPLHQFLIGSPQKANATCPCSTCANAELDRPVGFGLAANVVEEVGGSSSSLDLVD